MWNLLDDHRLLFLTTDWYELSIILTSQYLGDKRGLLLLSSVRQIPNYYTIRYGGFLWFLEQYLFSQVIGTMIVVNSMLIYTIKYHMGGINDNEW